MAIFQLTRMAAMQLPMNNLDVDRMRIRRYGGSERNAAVKMGLIKDQKLTRFLCILYLSEKSHELSSSG